jgi:hypothetical protein
VAYLCSKPSGAVRLEAAGEGGGAAMVEQQGGRDGTKMRGPHVSGRVESRRFVRMTQFRRESLF